MTSTIRPYGTLLENLRQFRTDIPEHRRILGLEIPGDSLVTKENSPADKVAKVVPREESNIRRLPMRNGRNFGNQLKAPAVKPRSRVEHSANFPKGTLLQNLRQFRTDIPEHRRMMGLEIPGDPVVTVDNSAAKTVPQPEPLNQAANPIQNCEDLTSEQRRDFKLENLVKESAPDNKLVGSKEVFSDYESCYSEASWIDEEETLIEDSEVPLVKEAEISGDYLNFGLWKDDDPLLMKRLLDFPTKPETVMLSEIESEISSLIDGFKMEGLFETELNENQLEEIRLKATTAVLRSYGKNVDTGM